MSLIHNWSQALIQRLTLCSVLRLSLIDFGCSVDQRKEYGRIYRKAETNSGCVLMQLPLTVASFVINLIMPLFELSKRKAFISQKPVSHVV